MPHKKFGKVGLLPCGGAVLEGLPQAVQLYEFNKAGINPDWIGGVSVGALNAANYKNPVEIWKNHVTSSSAIYDLNPALKSVFKEARQFFAPFKKHESWKEWLRDFKLQKHNILQVLWFLKRTGTTFIKVIRDFPNGEFANQKNFSSLSEFAISALKEHDLYTLQSLLDIQPLMNVMQNNIDLEKTLKEGPPLNIFVRHLNSGKEKVLVPQSVPELMLGLQAASALVPFFEPVKIDEEYFCDIGAINPFPAEYAFNAGCDTVFAFAKGQRKTISNPKNVIESWTSEVEIHTEKMFTTLYQKARERAKKEGKNLFVITPHLPQHPDLGFLSISPEAIEHTIEKETEATQKFLEKILK